ncbi:hypothetical protein [Streptomyces sp. NPDC006879]|uniref:hypothetical protein n=1 Tax=Streptomyces sp. NPDC006879 TaxID=3364767 RepID=UPI0036CFB4AE
MFAASDVETLHQTNTNVVVAKPSSAGGTPDVAWIVYAPFQNNTMTWEEQYGIYASNVSTDTSGVVLTQLANRDGAQPGQIYTFSPAGTFLNPVSGGTEGSFTIKNQNTDYSYLTMGLYQSAVVNGISTVGNAVSAAPVLSGSTAQITPYTTVYVWTQSNISSNSVDTIVTSTKTEVIFGGSDTSAKLQYVPGVGFTLLSGSQEDVTLKHHRRAVL